jgi:lipopolysaccharide/colanic/teichoic acid biosynthesis glycosyltransferase
VAGESSFLASGRSGVILHPTMIYGATGEGNVQRLASLLRLVRIIPLPNGGRALVQPIYQDDVTRALRAALDIAWDGSCTMVIAGPTPVPYADFARAVAAAAGIKGIRIVGFPLAPLMAAAWLLGPLPFLPKVRPAELRRLCEDKDFDIGPMREVLNVRPLALDVGLATTFASLAKLKSPRPSAAIRILDIVLASAGLIVTAPLLLFCLVLVRATTVGPGIFRQTRVGLNQRPFVCLKLRTMRRDTPSAASHDVGRSAITSVGGLLRRTKLDELPQLWNVLRGDMSLVGPRPCLPIQTELIGERDRLGVFQIRPGVTGPAQLLGIDMSEPRRLAEADAKWLSDPSAGSYVKMILLTALGRGGGDRAVR